MNEPPAPRYVFVSYATVDLALAEFVTRLLECRLTPPAEVFLAKRDIEPGIDPLAKMLKERLLIASALVALCSRDSRLSPWLWWETSSVWTRGNLAVPLFVDMNPNEFGGPLVLLSQGRQMFDANELNEALWTIVEGVIPGTGCRALEGRELAELARLEGEYRRRPRIGANLRRELLNDLLKLILESKDAAQVARRQGTLVTSDLINLAKQSRTVIGQLGEDCMPLEVKNWMGQGQDAAWVLNRWQNAYFEVEQMLLNEDAEPAR